MLINYVKSIISFWGIPNEEKRFYAQQFPYQQVDLQNGLKNLGFIIKPNDYSNKG
jgi:hypothetical protein